MAELTVSAGLARKLVDLATSKGAVEAALIGAAGINAEDLLEQDARLPLRSYVNLMSAAKDLTRDPALALRFGATVDMSEFSVVGLIFQTCETILESLSQINRYGRLIVEVDTGTNDRFQLKRCDGALWLVDTRRDADPFPELTEATFARFISMTRRFVSTPLVEQVHVTHSPPAHRAEYDRVFGAPTLFDRDWNAMRVDEAGLNTPIAAQPRYAFAILGNHADSLLADLENSKSIRGAVESLLIPILHTEGANMRSVATKLGRSRQGLYRQLREEGVTFQKVLDDLRHRMAVAYISGGRVSVNEAAFLVGFSDPAAFSRAFKRWTGASPRAMRSKQELI
jgi:AraC-like DNA-binding protein